MEVAPLRSLDDFIMARSRFQVPDIQNFDRWFNRVVNNLLYYQTNYFLSAFILFCLVSFLHPQKMAVGLFIVACLVGLTWYAQTQKAVVHQFKREHPLVVTTLVFITAYYIIYKIGSITVFIFGIILPVCFVVVHASLRLRNVKNKLVNATEALGLGKETPMAYVLRWFGIEVEIKQF